MPRSIKIKYLVLFFLFLVGNLAFADNALRCGNYLVVIGDSEAKVLARCGKPEQQISTNKVEAQINTISPIKSIEKVDIPVDIWTYNFGSQRLQYKLTFENGELVTIESGDYGYTIP